MKTGLCLLFPAAALLMCAGCETTPPAASQVTEAPSDEQEFLPQSVIVKGNVRYPVVPWRDDLTVTKAIVQADYIGMRNPYTISIMRQGERLFVDPARLQLGIIDPWLEPGDILELHMTAQIKRPYALGQYDYAPLKAVMNEP